MTLEEARQFVQDNLQKGVECPCCRRRLKKYRRKLTSGMAEILRDMFALRQQGQHEVNISKTLLNTKRKVMGQDYSKLKHWGLLDSCGKSLWSLTALGQAFVTGMIAVVPRFVYLVNNEVVGFSSEGTTFQNALSDSFDLSETQKEGE